MDPLNIYVKHEISILTAHMNFSTDREKVDTLNSLKVTLSQKVQDSFFIANFATKNIPKNYLKLLCPVHGIDKLLI